ncbi:MAG: metallophosphoesterase [Lachnospiraceae bacterium]|nr:metallophosphoesterase [Lachnospiraceae bacterium]
MLIFIILAVIILIAVYIYTESTSISVTEYLYTFDKLKADEYSFVFLTDLHGMVYGGDNEKLLGMIDELSPDAIMLAGDMITAGDPVFFKKTDEDRIESIASESGCHATLSFLERLKKKYPIYYGIGNHEEKLKRNPEIYSNAWERYTGSLEDMGLHILENETVRLEKEGIMIYGLDLEHKYYRKIVDRSIDEDYVERIFGPVCEDAVSILLAHFPDQFEGYARWGADLVLSGHVHGGVIRIPFLGGLVSPQLKLFPKYDCGEFKEGKSTMILSRGIGTHSVPIRINNRAEIVYVKLKRGEKQ